MTITDILWNIFFLILGAILGHIIRLILPEKYYQYIKALENKIRMRNSEFNVELTKAFYSNTEIRNINKTNKKIRFSMIDKFKDYALEFFDSGSDYLIRGKIVKEKIYSEFGIGIEIPLESEEQYNKDILSRILFSISTKTKLKNLKKDIDVLSWNVVAFMEVIGNEFEWTNNIKISIDAKSITLYSNLIELFETETLVGHNISITKEKRGEEEISVINIEGKMGLELASKMYKIVTLSNITS
jgi:hypothetical protein